MSRFIYKIVPKGLWDEAVQAGVFSGSPVDHSDGYIHLSDATQVRETASRHFAGQHDLVLVTVDPDSLGTDLRWEPSRGGQLFPHLYASLDPSSVVRVDPLPLGQDGAHRFPSSLDDGPQ